MAKFSERSLDKLSTCHKDLQKLAKAVVKNFDCTVVTGHRNSFVQDILFKQGKSQVKYPNSKHNSSPSMAVDLSPYINGKASWNNLQCYFFAGYVKRVAEELKIKIRMGADWDMDRDVNDHKFKDPCHFELVKGE